MRVEKTQKTPTPEQRQAADPKHSVWVGASAGSGKTQVLTDRLIRLLLTGVPAASILCLTYTKAGASEMQTRLFKDLASWSTCTFEELVVSITRLTGEVPDAAQQHLARSLFARALETPGGLKVQTIHAFCERLLQLFPIEAGMVPGFRVMDETEAALLMREAITQSLADDDPVVVEGWTFLSGGDLANLEALENTMLGLLNGNDAVRSALQKPHGPEEALLKLANAMGLIPIPVAAEIGEAIVAINEDDYRGWIERAEAKQDNKHASLLHDVLNSSAEQRLSALRKLHFTGTGTVAKDMFRRTWAKVPDVAEAIAREQERVVQQFDKLWSLDVFNATLAVYRAAANVLLHLDHLKRRRGLYGFDDLIARTRALLGKSAQSQWVLYKLDAGLTHVLVDEAQDTSPAQWQIVMPLIEEFFSGEGVDRAYQRSIFVVGDRKQSIFSFQGADVGAFETAKDDLQKKVSSGGQHLREVNLAVSYRSLALVLKAVDAVFARGSTARAGFGQGGADEPDHTPNRADARGLVEIWPLVEKPDTEAVDYWREPVDRPPEDHPRRILAKMIAREIKSWIGRRVLPGKPERIVQPGDIMILLQSRNPLFSALIAELRRLGVPVAGADRLDLGKTIVIADLLMLLQWLSLEADDHALACLLKSPLVPEPLTEDQLFTLAHDRNTMTLWARLGEGENRKRLQAYKALALNEGPHGFLAKVTQLCRRDILQRLGGEAEDAIREMLQLALDFEQQHPASLSGFAQWFGSAEHVVKREMDPAAGEVRIMTVHGAKGLEAPIVFLADAGDTKRGNNKTRLIKMSAEKAEDRLAVFEPQLPGTPEILKTWKAANKMAERRERLRLLYVGMTRAMDALYVCGVAPSKTTDDEAKAKKTDKDDTKEISWWTLVSEALTSTLKDAHTATLGDGTPVRRLGDDPRFLDSAVSTESTVASGVPAWAIAFPSLPPLDQRARHLARSETAFDSAAAREGLAIHRYFELAPTLSAPERARLTHRLGLSAEMGRGLGALLDDPALAVFFGPDSEAEVLLSGGDQTLRRIDRLARRNGMIHILDFKTGQRPSHLTPDHPYVRQMAGYAAVLRQAYPGERVKAALLWTQACHLEWLPDNLLAQP